MDEVCWERGEGNRKHETIFPKLHYYTLQGCVLHTSRTAVCHTCACVCVCVCGYAQNLTQLEGSLKTSIGAFLLHTQLPVKCTIFAPTIHKTTQLSFLPK